MPYQREFVDLSSWPCKIFILWLRVIYFSHTEEPPWPLLSWRWFSGKLQVQAKYNCYLHVTPRATRAHLGITKSLNITAVKVGPLTNQELGLEADHTLLSPNCNLWESFTFNSSRSPEIKQNLSSPCSAVFDNTYFLLPPQCQWLAFCPFGKKTQLVGSTMAQMNLRFFSAIGVGIGHGLCQYLYGLERLNSYYNKNIIVMY